MDRRLELHEVLVNLLGSRSVYYQPKEEIKLNYPVIVYEISDVQHLRADNISYRRDIQYQLTFITREADSPTISKLLDLPMANFVRSFEQDGLNHYIQTIYF